MLVQQEPDDMDAPAACACSVGSGNAELMKRLFGVMIFRWKASEIGKQTIRKVDSSSSHKYCCTRKASTFVLASEIQEIAANGTHELKDDKFEQKIVVLQQAILA